MSVPLFSGAYKGKKIDIADFDPLQRLAFNTAFPFFSGTDSPTAAQQRQIDSAVGRGIPITWQSRPDRRFAGDDSLPSGRYYTLIRKASGDDGKALVMELVAYHNPSLAGPIQLLDLGHENDAGLILGEEPEAVHAIALIFLDPGDRPAPFFKALRRAGLEGEHDQLRSRMNIPDHWLGLILLPYKIVELDLDKVVDLRYPECQDWFVSEFGTSTFEKFLAGNAGHQNITDFPHLLPALVNPVPGGGMFDSISQYVGHWLRTHDIDALAYPSARTDASVLIRDGQIEDHRGWNLVDYRGAPRPTIDVMLNLSVGPPPYLPPGVSIVLPPPTEPSLRGSFTVRGLQQWHVNQLNRPEASGILDLQ